MGTRGYKVYRRRGRFFMYYLPCDAYPDGFGRSIISSIPRDPQTYQKWLRKYRQSFDKVDGNGNVQVQKRRPVRNLFIEYVYEIDLDNETFFINGFPMFRLDHMPSVELFLRIIGKDHYNHIAPKRTLPQEHKYLTAPLPPPSPDGLEAYRTCQSISVLPNIHDLLCDSEDLSPTDIVRLRVYEIFVGGLMRIPSFLSSLVCSELAGVTKGILWFVEEIAVKMVALAFQPMVFYPTLDNMVDDDWEEAESGHVWVRPDVCVRAAIHLGSDEHLHASIGILVQVIRETSKEGIVYGVLCSLFYVVIVKVDMSSGGSFVHTPALQFLPSRFATSPSTPGITALLRLAFLHDHEAFDKVLGASAIPTYDYSPTYLDSIPQELLQKIASYITNPISLLAFGILCEGAKTAACKMLCIPSINGFRLLPMENRKHDEGAAEEDDEATHRNEFACLVTREFDAVDETGAPVRLRLGSDSIWSNYGAVITLFSIGLSKNGFTVGWKAELVKP